jgi:hypothetical protein
MVPSQVGPVSQGPVAILEPMLKQVLRFALLRFLPRRVVPILAAIEVFQLVRRLRRRGPEPVAPRRMVTVDGPTGRSSDAPAAPDWRAGWDSNPRHRD